MQPYFFPYLGQFALLNQVDMWIAYDPAQYIRHGWVNRNRVLHPTTGWQYMIVPLAKHAHKASINEVEIAGHGWEIQLFKQLRHYHMDAPFYKQVIQFLEELFAPQEINLSRLNVALFRATAQQLGIRTPIHVFSEMNLGVSASGPENLALSISRAVGASEYVNPPGGVDLYSPLSFAEHGIKLTIQAFTPMTYSCGRFAFIPNLSVIDALMWNSPQQIKHYLDTLRNG